MTVITQAYIGDGIYAEFFDDGTFRLWTDRRDGTHELFLDPDLLKSLNASYARALAKLETPQ